MTKSLPRSLRTPRFLLAAIGFLSCFLIQSGELGTSDTMHRLQTAHSFWTSQPPVFRSEYPEFGLVGRGGRLYSWYGMGQSLLMLPADIAGTLLERLPVLRQVQRNRPKYQRHLCQLYHEYPACCSDGLAELSIAGAVRLHRQTVCCGSVGPLLRHYPPALHPEHDREQLHPVADRSRGFRFSMNGCAPGIAARWRSAPRPSA